MTAELQRELLTLSQNVTTLLNNLNLARPSIPLPTFTGRNNDKSFSAFIKEFNRVANASGWNETSCAQIFPSCLKSEAAAIYENLTAAERTPWRTLLDNMAQKLAGSNDIVSTYRRQANNRKQKPNESLSEFAENISELVTKGYPDSAAFTTAMRDSLSIDIFRSGVNSKIKEHILRREKPATLAAALSEAINEESLIDELSRELVAVNLVNNLNIENQPLTNFVEKNNFNRPNFNRNRDTQIPRNPRFNSFQQNPRYFPPRPYNNYNNRSYNNYNNRFPARNNFPPFSRFNPQNSNYRNTFTPNFPPRNNFYNPQNIKKNTKKRGTYRINTVEGLLPIISVSIVILALSSSTEAARNAYNLCSLPLSYQMFAPPEHTDCSIPKIEEKVVETEVTLIVPRTKPINFVVYECTKFITHLCTFSILKLYTSIPTNLTTQERIPPKDCWMLIKEGKIQSVELERVEKDVWISKQEIPVRFATVGTICNYTLGYRVVKGIASVLDDRSEIISDIGDLTKCRTNKNFCEKEKSTIVWEPFPPYKLCKYEAAGNFNAIFAGRYVLIERIQAAFVFSYEEHEDNLRNCFTANTYVMENNVFITVRNMTTILDTGPKFILPIQLDIKQNESEINEREKRQIRLREPPRHPTTEKPRIPPLYLTHPTLSTSPRSTFSTTTFIIKTPPILTSTSIPYRSTTKTTTIRIPNTIRTTKVPLTVTTTQTPSYMSRTKITPPVIPTRTPSTTFITTNSPIFIPTNTEVTRKMTTTSKPSQKSIIQTRKAPKKFLTTQNPSTIEISTQKPPSESTSTMSSSTNLPIIYNSEFSREKAENWPKHVLIKNILRQKFIRSLSNLPEQDPLIEKTINISSQQADKNLNARLQFFERKLEKENKENFNKLWKMVCELNNRQNDVINSILKINPQIGSRLWFKREDISGKFIGEAVAIFECMKFIPKRVIWNHQIGKICYEDTPVEIEWKEKLYIYFIVPGSKDLKNTSEEVGCEKIPKSIYKDAAGKWTSITGVTKVQIVPNIFNYERVNDELIFQGKNIFQSDLSDILSSLAIISNYANKINRAEKALSNKTFTYVEDQENIFSDILEKIGEKVETVKNMSKIIMDPIGTIDSILEEWKTISYITVFIIALITFIGTIIYFYPWISPIFKRCNKRRKKMFGRSKEYTVNHVDASAPTEEYPMIDYVPKIYQVSTNCLSYERIQPRVDIIANNLRAKALLDTGSSISYCKMGTGVKICNVCKASIQPMRMPVTARTANNSAIEFLGTLDVEIDIGKHKIRQQLLVSKDGDCPFDILLGIDFIKKLNDRGMSVAFNINKNKITIGDEELFLHTFSVAHELFEKPNNKNNEIRIENDITIEPFSDYCISIHKEPYYCTKKPFVLISENNKDLGSHVKIGKTLCTKGNIFVRLLNTGRSVVKIYKNMPIALFQEFENEYSINFLKVDGEIIDDPNPNYISPEVNLWNTINMTPEKKDVSSNLDLKDSCLSEEYKKMLRFIIARYSKAFVEENGIIGHFTGPIKHKIDLINENLIVKSRPYKVPIALREEIKKQIEDMLAQKIIRTSNSAFASPIVLVKKSDNKSYRFAIDYRKLNSVTQKQIYHLPLIQEIIEQVAGKSIFSCFDLQSGFHQIEMDEKDIPKTAFISFMGLFEFLRMPFGLAGAPETFQRAMEILRRQLSNSFFVYLDDIILCSYGEAEHLADIKEFLKAVIKHNIKLRLDKCKFARPEVKYLGFIIGEYGIRPDPKNVSAVKNFKPPKTLTELRSFIGAVTYFRRFIKNFAHIMSPLYELLKISEESDNNIEKKWTVGHTEIFEIIKQKLITAPILLPPKFSKPFVIDTDASKIALGACLLQHDDQNILHPVAYSSRKLNKHEQKYAAVELEALGIVYAINEFRAYVEGTTNTIVRTDSSALCSLLKRKDLIGRLAKYQISLQAFHLSIIHRPGKLNTFCDHLSRHPADTSQSEISNIVNVVKIPIETLVAPYNENIKITAKEFKREQKKIEYYNEIYNALKKNIFPNRPSRRKEIERRSENFTVVNGLLYHHDCIVVPYTLREKIIESCHSNPYVGGHMGIEKTGEKIKKRFYWKGMDQDIAKKVSECKNCQKNKTLPNQRIPEPLHPITPPTQPFRRIHIDITGPFADSNNYKYIFACIDAFTKYVILCPMIDQKSMTVISVFVDHVISKFGCPNKVISDNGRQFTSHIFNELSIIYGFEHKFITPYNPQSNGEVERVNRTIGNMLATYTNKEGWDLYLQPLTFAFNTAVHSSTQFSPFYAMFGRDPLTPMDVVMKINLQNVNNSDFSLYTDEIAHRVRSVWIKIEENLKEAQRKQKLYSDMTRKAEEHEFKINDLVLMWKDHIQQHNKLSSHWFGPYRILSITRPNVILREIGTDKIINQHLNKIKFFKTPSLLPFRKTDQYNKLQNKSADPNIEDSDNEEEGEDEEVRKVGEVEKINVVKVDIDESTDKEGKIETKELGKTDDTIQLNDDTDTLVWILNHQNVPEDKWPRKAIEYVTQKRMKIEKEKNKSEIIVPHEIIDIKQVQQELPECSYKDDSDESVNGEERYSDHDWDQYQDYSEDEYASYDRN
jgi:hypothetical protein